MKKFVLRIALLALVIVAALGFAAQPAAVADNAGSIRLRQEQVQAASGICAIISVGIFAVSVFCLAQWCSHAKSIKMTLNIVLASGVALAIAGATFLVSTFFWDAPGMGMGMTVAAPWWSKIPWLIVAALCLIKGMRIQNREVKDMWDRLEKNLEKKAKQ